MKQKTIKIGVASAYFAIVKGGGEHYTLYLSNELANLGHNITIICGKQPFKTPRLLSNNFNVEYIPQLYFLREWGLKLMKPINFVASTIHYQQYIYSCYIHLSKKHDFDIIHTHDPASFHAAVKLKRKYNVPIVSTFHGLPSPSHIKDAKNVDAIFAVSKEIKSCFERNDIQNVYEIPGGVDLSRFKPLDKEKCKNMLGLNGNIILFVGRLVPIKNLFTLLSAFKEVKSAISDTKLLIIGDGSLKKELVQKAQELGLSEDVTFTGAISNEELPRYYNAADVFILPSHFESFSLVCLEAAACGLPIVISTGADAIIKDFGRDAFFLVKPDDIQNISECLIQALMNKNIARTRSELCLKRVKFYTWEERAKQTEKVFEKVIHN